MIQPNDKVTQAGLGKIAWLIVPDFMHKLFVINADKEEDIWPILSKVGGEYFNEDDASYEVYEFGLNIQE